MGIKVPKKKYKDTKDKNMKNAIKIISVFLITIILFTTAIITYHYIVKERAYNDKLLEETMDLSVKQGATPDETFRNFLLMIPNDVTKLLLQEGWGYSLNSSEEMLEIAKQYGYEDGLLGLCDYQNKIIYVSEDRMETVIHEVYHAVDSILGFPSKNNESIYNTEHDTFLKQFPLVSEDNTDNVMEYFAEAFQRYIINGSQLKKSCPETYDYLTSVIEICKNRLY